jgi:hypothetical protein
MAGAFAAVTCDITGSTRYPAAERRRVNRHLRRSFETLTRRYAEAVHTPTSFSVIKGDEFQFVLRAPEKAYEVVVFYRALCALADVRPALTFRAAIGVGGLAVSKGASSYALDGEAFHRSRGGMELFAEGRERRRRRTLVFTGDARREEVLDVLLGYQDLLESRWTRPQWEAVRWRMESATYEEIASRLRVSYQSVQKRLKAACWEEFHRGMVFLGRTLGEPAAKAAT